MNVFNGFVSLWYWGIFKLLVDFQISPCCIRTNMTLIIIKALHDEWGYTFVSNVTSNNYSIYFLYTVCNTNIWLKGKTHSVQSIIYIQIHFEQQRRTWSKTNSDLSSTMTCCLTLLTACHLCHMSSDWMKCFQWDND